MYRRLFFGVLLLVIPAAVPAGVSARAAQASADPRVSGRFAYDPYRYAQLTALMERCAPQPNRTSAAHRILEHPAMKDSVPGTDLQSGDVTRSVFPTLFLRLAL
jgi:hypothetical protein